MRRALEDERERVAAQVGDLTRTFDAIVESTEGESTDDEHDPDGSTIAFERAQVWALLTSAREQLTAVEAALERVDENDFGTCAGCGQAIDPERIRALPAASLCIECASAASSWPLRRSRT